MTPSFLSTSLLGNHQATAESIGLTVPDEWFVEQKLMDIRLAQLEQDPSLQPWLLRAIALRHEPVMIGHIGFHSQPAPQYLHEYAPQGIEFGYAVYPSFRRQGYASEACSALMAWAAANHGITQFVLTIAPDNTPSQRIAQRFGSDRLILERPVPPPMETIFMRAVEAQLSWHIPVRDSRQRLFRVEQLRKARIFQQIRKIGVVLSLEPIPLVDVDGLQEILQGAVNIIAESIGGGQRIEHKVRFWRKLQRLV